MFYENYICYHFLINIIINWLIFNLRTFKNIIKNMHIVVDQLSSGLQTTRNVKFKYIFGGEEDICVVYRYGLRTHALVPCVHKVLCRYCSFNFYNKLFLMYLQGLF